jgi:CRISPR-associated protein Csm4
LKLYEIILKPLSGFGTMLKGDTLFGHFCWQVAYDPTLLDGGLQKWISRYGEKPFVVFSSAWPKIEDNGKFFYALKRPDMPISFLFPTPKGNKKETFEQLKENKKKKWMKIDESLSLDLNSVEYLTNKDIAERAYNQATSDTRRMMREKHHQEFCLEFVQQHNTINRMTMTTGEGMFAPFSETNFSYYPEMELAVFVLIDEDATEIEKVLTALENIGKFGFGKNASTGCGRFNLGENDELPLPVPGNSNACYVLSPCVPEKEAFKDVYFTPFVRFGKHGDRLACYGNPFKNPVIMADEGAVFIPNDHSLFNKPYIGQAVTHVSKAMPETVVQGYAPYLPLKLEI